MSSDYRIMLSAVLDDRKFWILYLLACFGALFFLGFSAVKGVMIMVAMFITLAVFSVSLIFSVMLITDLKNETLADAGLNLSHQAPD
jgi:hypothetical protein